jgi:hypothetical protein
LITAETVSTVSTKSSSLLPVKLSSAFTSIDSLMRMGAYCFAQVIAFADAQ